MASLLPYTSIIHSEAKSITVYVEVVEAYAYSGSYPCFLLAKKQKNTSAQRVVKTGEVGRGVERVGTVGEVGGLVC